MPRSTLHAFSLIRFRRRNFERLRIYRTRNVNVFPRHGYARLVVDGVSSPLESTIAADCSNLVNKRACYQVNNMLQESAGIMMM